MPNRQRRRPQQTPATRTRRAVEPAPNRSSSSAPTLAASESPFRLEVRRSHVHRWGVFALESIPANHKVIEYKGARISMREATREFRKTWAPGKILRVSLFLLDKIWLIDGDDHGNGAVIINHSCDPNLHVRRLRGHILYFSRRKIRQGEELLIDYRFPAASTRTPCHCGAKNCRGVINELAPQPAVKTTKNKTRKSSRPAKK